MADSFKKPQFAALLKQYRKERRLTQAKLAEKFEAYNSEIGDVYDKSAISRWENGKTKPHTRHVVDILERVLFVVPKGFLLQAYDEAVGVAGQPRDHDPTASNAKAEHFDRLVEIVAELLADGVGTVTKVEPDLLPGQQVPENWARGEAWIKIHGRWQPLIYRRELSVILGQKWESMQRHYKKSELNGLMCHVFSEFTDYLLNEAEFKYVTGFMDLSLDHPYELVKKLIELTNTKAFKGTCPDCPQ